MYRLQARMRADFIRGSVRVKAEKKKIHPDKQALPLKMPRHMLSRVMVTCPHAVTDTIRTGPGRA